ncbi:MAG: tRNA lysidine(34) synthetase TilS [Rhizobiaceae bacterium]
MVLDPRNIFRGIEPGGITIVAVSGGSDSLALLLLAHAWAQEKDITLHAVTVDHGLRPESAAEAAFVASICDALDVDHTTLGWEGVKPQSGISDAARRARYNLIEEFALDIGCDMILAAHTSDDQAETVYMRLKRELLESARNLSEETDTEQDSGLRQATTVSLGRGMAGMSRISLLPGGTVLVRPLLGVTRKALRDYLSSFPQSWIEDPTNDDEAYERVRVRKLLASQPGRKKDILAFTSLMARMRGVLSRDTAMLLEIAAGVTPGPVYTVQLAKLSLAPRPVALHALQVLIAVAGGGEHLPSRASLETLAAALIDGRQARGTIGGVVIERSGDVLRLFRELRNLRSMHIAAGETAIWDGRLEIINSGNRSIHVAPLTRRGLADLETERGKLPNTRPRAALLSTPVIHIAGGGLFLPLVESGGEPPRLYTRVTARAIEQFCPQTDFPVLDWLRELDGARKACLLPRH